MDNVITSGTFISLTHIKEIGGFNEKYFIDHVDTEFCWRTITNNERIVVASDIGLIHEIGHPTKGTFAGRSFMTSNHVPARRYYQGRNLVWLVKEYGHYNKRWAWKLLKQMVKTILGIIIGETDRLRKLCRLFSGILMGIITSP